ncbi:hypothetical protein TanjilG_11159 [Lupinus angustifolius]|uniref:Uncharacterized protein n=1 Tax=Lupinus angustifolius TaxID=3871 RepID=A0A1J7IXP2_LUPAN|nr:hypothetical protein TanjilG_11159 [Lupinus angustifolius]
MNAVVLTDVLKVAVRPKVDDETGIAKHAEIARVIKIIMEAEKGVPIRERINDTSQHSSSTRTLSNLPQKWQNI